MNARSSIGFHDSSTLDGKTMRVAMVIIVTSLMTKMLLADIKTEYGVIVDYKDNCDPRNIDSCGDHNCCVKERMAYSPGYDGTRPLYRVTCSPLRHEKEFCMTQPQHEMCPCGFGLKCVVSIKGTIVGHCAGN